MLGLSAMTAKLVSALIVFVPLALVAWLALRRQPRAILWFALALCAVGSGYLSATGAADEFARVVLGSARDASLSAKPAAPSPAPAK